MSGHTTITNQQIENRFKFPKKFSWLQVATMYANIIYFLYISIFVFHTCHGRLQTILSNQQLIRSENLVEEFIKLLMLIYLEVQYDYIVIVKDVTKTRDCIFQDSIVHWDKPIIIISDLNYENYWQLQHPSNFILLTCSFGYIERFNISNTVYQYVPHVLLFEGAEINEKMEEFCSKIHQTGYFKNLIITPQSLKGETKYITCDFHKNLKSISHQLFVNPFLNLQGLTITTESDQLPPRSILFYDDFGQLKLIGFVANYLTTFAQRYNATLSVIPPADMGVTVHYDYLANKTFQGILDIAAVAARYKVDTFSESYSYPVELMEYCYMIPLPHMRPLYNIFFDIIEVKAMLIVLIYFIAFSILLNIGQQKNTKLLSLSKIVLNDKSMRGLLGQSFVMPRNTSMFMKCILFLLCYSSILLCTSYQAYLQSHLVHPSLEKRMETYDDIRKNNFKILIDDRESVYVYGGILERYNDLFVKETNFYRFLKLRDSMDIRYIFPVSRTRWSVFQERQKLFQRKLFYFSSQLCLNNLVLLSFPLRPGLPYKLQFDQHLLDIRDVGLLDCWLEHNFLIMVRMKLSSFKDLSVADDYGTKMTLNDLLWIWIAYAACISLSCLVFLAELLLNKIKCLNKS